MAEEEASKKRLLLLLLLYEKYHMNGTEHQGQIDITTTRTMWDGDFCSLYNICHQI